VSDFESKQLKKPLLPRGLAPLHYRDFRLYFFGNGASFIGSQVEMVATAWLLYELTHSPLLLGLNGFFHAVPTFLIVPLAGTLADRLSQRRLLLLTQSMAFTNSLVLGLLIVTGLIQPWHVYLQGFLQASVTAFDVTARQALFPRLVPREELDQAVTLNFSMSRIAMLSGPAIGGFVIGAFGVAWPYFLNAASFLLMLVAMIIIREPANASAPSRKSLRSDLFGGFAFILQSPVIAAIFLFATLWAILSHNTTMITVFAKDILNVGPEGLGVLMSAIALGQLAGSLGLVGYGEVRGKGRLLLASGLLYSAAMIVFALSRSFFLSVAFLGFSGIGNALFSATRHTILQRASPDNLRGRVMGAHLMITRGVNPLSQTLSGLVLSVLGPVGALVTTTVLLACVTVAITLNSPVLRNFSPVVPDSP